MLHTLHDIRRVLEHLRNNTGKYTIFFNYVYGLLLCPHVNEIGGRARAHTIQRTTTFNDYLFYFLSSAVCTSRREPWYWILRFFYVFSFWAILCIAVAAAMLVLNQ